MLNGSDHKNRQRGSTRMATGTAAGGKQTIRNETKRCAKSCSCTLYVERFRCCCPLSRLVSPMWMGQDVRRQRQAEPQPEQETELGPSQVGLKLTLLSNYIKMIGNVGHICVARVAAEPRCDCGQARVQQESRTNNRRQRSAGGGRRTNAGLVCRSAASRQQGAGGAACGRRQAACGMLFCRVPVASCPLPVADCGKQERSQTQRRRCADAASASSRSSTSSSNDADDCGPLIAAAATAAPATSATLATLDAAASCTR